MKKSLSSILLITTAFLIFSCQSNKKGTPELTEYDTLMVEFSSMFGVRSNMQTVIDLMIKSGIKYSPELTIDTLIRSEYFESLEVSALICGVFSGDAIYHSAFGNSNAAFESYTSAQVLANHLGIGPYYVGNLLKRRESDLVEADSLLFKFDQILAEFDTNLTDEKRFKIISSYLIGNTIEKLFLIDKGISSLEGKKVADISMQAKFLFDLVVSEEKSIDMFVAIMDKYSADKGNPLHAELISLQALYKKLHQKGLPEYAPDEIYKPTQELIDVSQQIEATRNLFVLSDN